MPVTPAWRANSALQSEIIFNDAFGKKIHNEYQARLGVPEIDVRAEALQDSAEA
jgi:hypothetical protein